MIIIDGDYPMAHNGLKFQRDLTKPISEVRSAGIINSEIDTNGYSVMASLPEMRKGEVAVAIVKVVCCILRPGNDHGDVPTDLHAYASGKSQMAYYHMLETMKEVNLLKFQNEFKDHMDLWLKEDDHMNSPVGMVLGMEGADSITTPDQLQEWYDDGLRLISLSHYGVSRYSHGTGTGTEGGLVGNAKELLQEMDSLNMILDVSHTSDESVRQELEIFEGPVIATHQNCRSITPGERQFPDHQIKSVIERGGVIGHSMDTYMLWSKEIDWSNIPPERPFPKDEVTLENYVDHIDYVCQLAGNSLHAAIGGDTDGQGGMIGAPYEIDTVADYQKIVQLLEQRGYENEDIENIMYKNWQRFFELYLPN
tara:strand:- start:76 stop:1173 length:1098 start_codon:yes stop_codon:yes gene_type:complete